MGRTRTRDKKLPRNLYCRNGYYSYRHPIERVEYGLGRDRLSAVMHARTCNQTLAANTVARRVAEGLTTMLTPLEIVSAAYDRNDLSGVYFLINNGEIVYVGQSMNVHKRISEHARQKEKEFDAFHYVVCDPAMLDELENAYIIALAPRYNRAFSHQKARHMDARTALVADA